MDCVVRRDHMRAARLSRYVEVRIYMCSEDYASVLCGRPPATPGSRETAAQTRETAAQTRSVHYAFKAC